LMICECVILKHWTCILELTVSANIHLAFLGIEVLRKASRSGDQITS